MVEKTPGGVAVAKCCRIWVLILSAIERIEVWGWGMTYRLLPILIVVCRSG